MYGILSNTKLIITKRNILTTEWNINHILTVTYSLVKHIYQYINVSISQKRGKRPLCCILILWKSIPKNTKRLNHCLSINVNFSFPLKKKYAFDDTDLSIDTRIIVTRTCVIVQPSIILVRGEFSGIPTDRWFFGNAEFVKFEKFR